MPRTTQKLKKIKSLISEILDKTIQEAKNAGYDIDTEEFKQLITEKKKEILSSVGVSEDEMLEYENQDKVLEQEIKKEIASAFDRKKIEKEKKLEEKILQERMNVVERFLSEINNKKQFTQEDINQLAFSQLAHSGIDHEDLNAKITISKNEINKELEIQKTDIEIEKKELGMIKSDMGIIKKNIPIYHRDLKEIEPNDHHREKHSLESHIDSSWKDKFSRLIGGGFVDDLHKHYVKGNQIVDIGGMTKNDADVYYVKYTGGIEMPSIATNGGKVLKVNAGSTALEWATEVSGTTNIKVESGTILSGTTVYSVTENISAVISLHIGGQFFHPSAYSFLNKNFTIDSVDSTGMAGSEYTVVYVKQ